MTVVCHRHHLDGRHQGHVYDALARRFAVRFVVVEEAGWPLRLSELPGGGEADAVLWQVKGRLLRDRPPFDWQGYPGPRIMLAHDAFRTYLQLVPGSEVLGMWPPMIQRQGFTLVLSSGKRVSELLRRDGVPAVWMPKAYAADWLHDTGADRAGIGYYGARYPARRAMLEHLARAGINVEQFACPETELNHRLNRHLGVVICNMGVPLDSGVVDPADRPFPELAHGLTLAPEAMLKNFEVAAAGAAPICDPTPDLAELGFLDGDTAVVYSDFDALVQRLDDYRERPERLREIGHRAAGLVRDRHTWDHRARYLERLLCHADPANAPLSWDHRAGRAVETTASTAGSTRSARDRQV